MENFAFGFSVVALLFAFAGVAFAAYEKGRNDQLKELTKRGLIRLVAGGEEWP